jgi:hypothetical protein
MVIESAVSGALLLKRSASSLNQGPLALITGVIVTPPVPPPGSLTVKLIDVDLVRPPPVQVTVRDAAPIVAVLDAASVRILFVPVVVGGVKDVVTPEGNPETLQATLAVNPPVRVMLMLLVPFAPRLIDRFGGEEESEKSGVGGEFTVRLIVVVRVRPPPVPVMLTVAGPGVAEPEAVKVRVLHVPVVEVGEKLAVTPPGNPVVLKATLAVNPPVRVTVIFDVPFAPRLIVRLGGDAERIKSGVGGALTVRLMFVVLVRPPPFPVIVTVAGPVVAVVDALNVRLLVDPLVDDGLKLAVTPLGNPLAPNSMLPLNPPVRKIFMTLPPLAPRLIERAAGFVESEKS